MQLEDASHPQRGQKLNSMTIDTFVECGAALLPLEQIEYILPILLIDNICRTLEFLNIIKFINGILFMFVTRPPSMAFGDGCHYHTWIANTIEQWDGPLKDDLQQPLWQ